jgi:hypothetical protein
LSTAEEEEGAVFFFEDETSIARAILLAVRPKKIVEKNQQEVWFADSLFAINGLEQS